MEFIEPTDLQSPDALQIIYKVLDSQCEQLSRERWADVYTRWERPARRPGERVDAFPSQFYAVLSELKVLDPVMVILPLAQADKLLRGANLPAREQPNALY